MAFVEKHTAPIKHMKKPKKKNEEDFFKEDIQLLIAASLTRQNHTQLNTSKKIFNVQSIVSKEN